MSPRSRKPYLVSRTVSHYDATPWREDVELQDELEWVNSRVRVWPFRWQLLAQRIWTMAFALRMLPELRRRKGIAIGRYGSWVPILNRLFRGSARVVMMDVEWKDMSRGRIDRRAAEASHAVVVNGHAEAERYARHYRIDPSKFCVVPLAFQHRDVVAEGSDGGYIFTGGTQGRDWATFFEAVDGLPWPVRVYTNRETPPPPQNVTIDYVSREEFFAAMAGASCVVIPVHREEGRVTGPTTWVTAMAMGKVCVATEPFGAPDYITQDVSGYWVDHGDAASLRRVLETVMGDADLRARVGREAKRRAWRETSPEVHRRRILSLLEGRDVDPPFRPEAYDASGPSTAPSSGS